MSNWFSSLFTGSNSTLDNDISSLGGNASFATNLGERDSTAASNFDNAILSGNQQQIGQVLAPQIGAIQKQTQQQKQVAGEFGDRSGGSSAVMASIDDAAHGHINDLIGELTGSAVSRDASQGSSLLSQGSADDVNQAGLSQQKLKNQENSIFGKGLTEATAAGESFLLG